MEKAKAFQVKFLDNANLRKTKGSYPGNIVASNLIGRPISSNVAHVVATLCDRKTSLLDLHVHAQVTQVDQDIS